MAFDNLNEKLISIFIVSLLSFSINVHSKDLIDLTYGQEAIKTISISSVVGNGKYQAALYKYNQSKGLTEANRIANDVLTNRPKPEEILETMAKMVFPVDTKSMRLNPNAETELKPIQIPAAIAIVGSDRYSRDWLKMNAAEIRRLNATVIVAKVKNVAEFESIQAIDPMLNLLPIDALPIWEQLKVDEYPVLITKNGLFR